MYDKQRADKRVFVFIKLCAVPTAESEITAVTDTAKEAVHIKCMCEEVGVRPLGVPLAE